MTKPDLNDFAWFVHVVEEGDLRRQGERWMNQSQSLADVLRNWRNGWAFALFNEPRGNLMSLKSGRPFMNIVRQCWWKHRLRRMR